MDYIVIAEVEIDGSKIDQYSGIILRQRFNEHHTFSIRINYDVLEEVESSSMANAQKKIGKPVVIRLKQIGLSEKIAYEFRGIICEVRMEQSDNSYGDLVLSGYSPTILLENGQHLTSFYQSDLKGIVQKITKPLDQNNCTVNINTQYKKKINYICQYRESSFHFLNRLSSEFSEWFYYDGKDLNFGKPSSSKKIDAVYGEDISSLQLSLRIVPATFSNYSYTAKDDKVLTFDAPSDVDGLGQYANSVLKESNNMYATPVNMPLRQRVENKSDLENFVKKQKAALAAGVEVLSAISNNPAIAIGAVVNIKISKLDNGSFVKEDYGEFLITGLDHYISDNGKYYNNIEAIPSGLEVLPVNNTIMPIAETQIATVKDNKDPDNMGRVRVQMLWQKENEMTDWIRVMTPDAGGGKDGAKNRGLVVVPEAGDQVVVCFRYNDPDRPFVMGSMFHGKTGGGGGQGNNTKSLNSKSGHTISMDDGKGITIVDKSSNNKIEIDGTNTITITAAKKIVLTNGKATITMEDDKISLSAAHIDIEGTSDAALHSDGDATVSGKKATVSGSSEAILTGPKATVNGDTEATLNGGGKTTVSAGGKVAVQGAIVALN